jgi:small-conductance mechanosensitive channel/CRP-like cAMP-binding protein
MSVILPHLLALTTDPLVLAGAVLVAGFLATRLALRHSSLVTFICQLGTFAGLTFMLAAAGVTPYRPTPAMAMTITYVVVCLFKMVWWIAASWLLSGFVRTILVFKRRPVETQFLQDLCAGIIYVGAILGIVAYVFDMAISGLLAASGVIAIVLGLALQSTLGDLFSGVVLNLAKPYHPGDWVILDGGLEGRVIETNWRATQILTEANDTAIIPNSIIAKARIINASKPTAAHGITIKVRLDPAEIPARVVAVLETALLSCNLILRVPAALVTIRSLDAMALECELAFFVPEIELGPLAQNEVFDLVYRHCLSARLRLAPPVGSANFLSPRAAHPGGDDVPARLLQRLAIFATLSEAERATLAPRLKRRVFKAGEVLVEQGVVAPALFILTSGVLAASQAHGERQMDVLRMAPGDFFGQASMLTGAVTAFRVRALTKVIVYEIDREDIAPILKERPAIAAELSQIMLRREATGKALLDDLAPDDNRSAHFSARITERVKELFGIA